MRRVVQFGSLVVMFVLLASAALAGEAPEQVIRISIGPDPRASGLHRAQ